MKHLLSIAMVILFATYSQAQDDYKSLWDEVEKYEMDGLPKSALQVVARIEKKAKEDTNKPQHIKALLYKSKYVLILEEDAQLSIINDFKSEIETAETPERNILENIVATLYWQYFQQNRYKFYNRTKTESKIDKEDFRTWDLNTLFEEIHVYYQKSLENGLIIKQEPLVNYDLLLLKANESKRYRPSLYDFLAHNALEFYKTDETSITKPSYQFLINDPKYLSDINTFNSIEIASQDTLSLQLNALKLYQNLISFHSKDAEPYALADVNIQRLKFVAQHATFNNVHDTLFQSLESSRNIYKDSEVSGWYDFEIASLLANQGNSYDTNYEQTWHNRWKLKEALRICDSVIDNYPSSRGSEQCTILKKQLLKESIQLTNESYIPIDKPSRVLVNYKNLDRLKFEIYNISIDQLKAFNSIRNEEDKLNFFKSKSPLKQWDKTLKNENDYQNHSTEIVIPKLRNGTYLILARTNNTQNTFAISSFHVTDIALVEKSYPKKNIYQLIDRNNGRPISGASIDMSYKTDYNSSVKTRSFSTDAKGQFSLPKSSSSGYFQIEFSVDYNGSKGYFESYHMYRSYRNRTNNKTNYRGFLFTDRSIYRPGQTVYFKGIVIRTKDNKSSVVENESVTVQLKNVNREHLYELKLQTNGYGSVNGEFIVPEDGLTGEFQIQMLGRKGLNAYQHFSVEEYKRPKFEAKFNPVTDIFKVKDSVTVKGNAQAYAGSNVTNAKVVYSIIRKVNYPEWYYWRRPFGNSSPQQIAFGESVTDASGNFEITFKAIPDETQDKSDLPIFQYEITADVTDINGETRSTTTIVNVGYQAMTANIITAPKLDKTKKDHELTIETKNLNGQDVDATGTIKIYKLLAPKKVVRKRPWNAPDYQELSEEEFKSLFPNDAYGNEINPQLWDKGAVVFQSEFDTKASRNVALGKLKKWTSGRYIIVLETKDTFGQVVKAESQIIVSSDQDKTVTDNSFFEITTDTDIYQIGDTAILTVGSAARTTVTLTIEKQQKIVGTYIIELNNNKKSITIPIEYQDLGGFVVHYSFAAFNDFQNGSTYINVPYPKTDLDIETTTFRDKLQPGSDETWSFKIKGAKGEQISAELLASMYDASLDQFKPHSWSFNPLVLSTYRSQSRWSARQSFGINNFRVYNRDNFFYSHTSQSYDRFNWYGFAFGNVSNIRRNYLKSINKNIQSSYNSSSKADIKTGWIEGKIKDESGLPIPGANIIISGTTIGTQSDFSGDFKIEAKEGATIQISFISFKTLEFKVEKSNYFEIVLVEDLEALDEVVVVGYGEVKSKSLASFQQIGKSIEYESDSMQTLEKNSLDSGQNDNKGIQTQEPNFSQIQIRNNLQETAFFFPQLQTDTKGNVSFSFTTPEALTQWKLQLLAHTKTLEHATKTLEAVTQKELMVIPNAPRFLRQGDRINISTKIANLTEQNLSGNAKLELYDAVSGLDITDKILKSSTLKNFNVDANGNVQVSWDLDIPDTVNAIQYKVLATTVDFSDGEQNALPVLFNRMLITETLPMWIRSNETRTFTLDKLKTNRSTSLKHHKLTLEITSNPAWYAVQALPYLMEYPYECNEQTFSRYYANALASYITNSNPRIQEVFKQWKNSNALLSNLEKNEAFKSLLIQETPWLRDAQSETEQKKRIALLFDLNKMNRELQKAFRKLKQNQLSDGAWSWFNGGYANRYITQHIIAGFGHLNQLGVDKNMATQEEFRGFESMIKKAISYLDEQFVKEYRDLIKYNKNIDLTKDHLSHTQLHFLYMRSFYMHIKPSEEVQEIMDYYKRQIQDYWLSRVLYSKGLMALIAHRNNDHSTALKIIKSLKETSITSDELGMYWKDNAASWYWHQAPIETQALIIEAFSEIEGNSETIDNLKIWLLKHKQTNRWQTTKATTEAIYALLLEGNEWLSVSEAVDVLVGGTDIEIAELENTQLEAGTGYYKTSWNSNEITPDIAEVSLTKKGDGIAWGSLYWQYFEDLDNITSAETPLILSKKLFLKTNTATGEKLSEVTSETKLNVGDLISVRIELRSDRNMEFLHMKDMRASGLEPINVLSQYKWQDGLGYYQSTKDASTNFFFDVLPKGVYVFEYDLRVTNAGNMSNGITSIQSMYAPEFSSHSEGARIQVN